MKDLKFSIIDSTFREGEQSGNFFMKIPDKIKIIQMLDDFGIEGIELSSPVSSEKNFQFCKTVLTHHLKAKIYTHVRCCHDDILKAIDTGVQGINLFLGTSPQLQTYSHGRDIQKISDMALDSIELIRKNAPQTEIRFSCEDTFRSHLKDILNIFEKIEHYGKADRYGLADTVGIAFPEEVKNVIKQIRQFSRKDIEFHGHNDSGCAIINSWTALNAGATHIDTSLLGIGERNGITPLCGLIARLYSAETDLSKYQLKSLNTLIQTFSALSQIPIPFNHYITGENAFCHKGGIHTNAVFKNPGTYECINPDDFGIQRTILINHEMTGWNSIKKRADVLNISINDEKLKELTRKIKEIAGLRRINNDEIDKMLRQYADM